MVRCIPTFLVLSLIISLSFNHPINIEDVDEIVETAGIQAFEDEIDDVVGIQVIEENIEEIDYQEYTIDDESTAGIQAFDDFIEEPTITEAAGIQAFEEDIIDIEIFSDDVDVPDTTLIGAAETEVPIPQPTDAVPEFQFEMVNAFEDLATDTINKLKALNVIRSKIRSVFKSLLYKNDNDSDSEIEPLADSPDDLANDSNDEDNLVDQPDEIETETPVNEVQETEVPENITDAPDIENNIPEFINNQFEEITTFVESNDIPTGIEDIITGSLDDEAPTEIFNEEFNRRLDDNDIVEIALFEIDNSEMDNEVEIVTETVTDVIVASVGIDDEEPTIGGFIDEPESEEIVPIFGVIEDAELDDDEVEIAIIKRNNNLLFANEDNEEDEVEIDITERNNNIKLANEDDEEDEEDEDDEIHIGEVPLEPVFIANIDEQETEVITEYVTEYIDEEPTIIN